MDFATFLNQKPNTTTNVLCFTSAQPIPFLFSVVHKKLHGYFDSLIPIDTIENEAALKALLEISFLGTKTLYWFSEDIITKYSFLTTYLNSYKGPHTIGFFSSKPHSNVTVIEIPTQIDAFAYQQLITFLYPQAAQKITTLFLKKNSR